MKATGIPAIAAPRKAGQILAGLGLGIAISPPWDVDKDNLKVYVNVKEPKLLCETLALFTNDMMEEHTITVVLLGDEGCGKSTFLSSVF